jgi:hypothetical protein
VRKTVMRLALIGCAVLAAVVGFWRGQDIRFADQWPIFDGLRQTAAIVFGVTGAWAAIVYPAALTSIIRRRDDLSDSEKTAMARLLPPMLLSTAVLLIVLVIALAAPVARRVVWLAERRQLVQGLSFATAAVLTVTQMWAVICMLVPLDRAKQDVDFAASRRRVLNDALAGSPRSHDGH